VVQSICHIRLKSVAMTEKQSILVADDNPDHRKMFRATLESGGYSVVEADSGREALAAIFLNAKHVYLLPKPF
jgi:CheY-like chemotaxis protein